MISKDELEKFKADLKAEIIKEITGKDLKVVNSKFGELDQVREKYKKLLYEKYGTYIYAQVWDHIRRLACYMVGVNYVRDLSPSKEFEAAKIIEKLCEMALEGRESDEIAK